MFTDTNSIGKRVAKTSFALSAFALLTMMAAAAFAAPPLSESGKSNLAKGHWGGTYGDVWIPGSYGKTYNVAPTLSGAAKAAGQRNGCQLPGACARRSPITWSASGWWPMPTWLEPIRTFSRWGPSV